MIKFLVTGQQLKIVTPIVVADTHNYQTAAAVFRGSEWEPCSKWAHFIKDGVTYDVPFRNDEITADQSLDLTAGTWQVYIHGNAYDAETDTVTTRITTSTALLKVEAAETESPFPPVTPGFSETLAAEVENALDVANGVRQDAASAFNGATFKPSVSIAGELSWTNDKGLPNPETVNIKGDPGKDGKGLQILGYYDSLDALTDAVTDPTPGEAYGIGIEHPYDIYIYDAVGSRWVNNGPVEGAKGDPGDNATIESVSVTAVDYDQPASVENVGTPSAAKFSFKIPKGYTPVKGTDYWTPDDIKEIGKSITPSMIGSIADPAEKSDGQVLAFDEATGKWVAVDMTSGVSSVDGKSGDVVTRIMFLSQTIAASSFTNQSSPKYANFPYVASKALTGVTAKMAPFVVFSPSDATSGNFCPVVDPYSGGIYIYANSAPSSSITIPLILCMAGDATLTGMSNSNGLYPGSVTYSKLAEKSVGASRLIDGAVTASKIAYGALVTIKNFSIANSEWTENSYGTYNKTVTIEGIDPAKHIGILMLQRSSKIPDVDTNWGFSQSMLDLDDEKMSCIFGCKITALNELLLTAKEIPAGTIYLTLAVIHI